VDAPGQCPICGSGNVASHAHKPPAEYFACRGCGLIFQHPLPSRDAMVAYADTEYNSGLYREYVEARAMKLRHFEDRLAQLGSHMQPGRLLDVGCSCGYFLEVAAARGFDVRGLEFSSSAIAQASPAVRGRITEGSLEHLATDESFDVISAFDLVEHVPDPIGFLRQCRDHLRPGGTIAVSTPDTGHLLRALMGSRWPMLQPMQHLHLFSKRALQRAFESAGLTTVLLDVAYKTLSLDYLVGQIAPFNPLISGTLTGLGRLMPRSTMRRYRQINIGELLGVARRPA
jgi:2-polyprenyl-3-methyl-5-hydroxy-6-metoxy-1,4-benzoquinol methylase